MLKCHSSRVNATMRSKQPRVGITLLALSVFGQRIKTKNEGEPHMKFENGKGPWLSEREMDE